jgi:hypothetical protein
MTPRAPESRPWIEILARIGFVAKGVLYATIGMLAGCAGLGYGGATTDTRGAMTRLLSLPFGRVVLLAVAVGLAGYAVWRCVEGIADPEHRGNDARAMAVRSSFVVRGAAHLWLAFGAIQATLGHPSSSGGTQSRQATATVFRFPKGDWVVLAAALGIGGFGAYQVYKAFAAKLHRHVNEREVTDEAGGWLIVVSRIGIAARGVVFMAIGVLLFHAAREHDPGKAGGIADALNEVARLGQWPFVATAAGLIAYGVYELLSARYRRIPAR